MASTTDLSPALRAEVARNLSARHIDQLTTGYLGFSCDELDEIKHDKSSGLDIIMEALRRQVLHNKQNLGRSWSNWCKE